MPVAPGPNSANYNQPSNGRLTGVGTNGGPSAYGTYDQGGNVWEWNDLNGTPNTLRGLRGGFWGSTADRLSLGSNTNKLTPTAQSSDANRGFRIASDSNPYNFLNLVTVGDANNIAYSLPDSDNGKGSVPATYMIGVYPITNCEYTEFLNAIAKTDTYEVYNPGMGLSGGINRTGSNGSYTYTVKNNMGNKPVIYVNWFDAARYCNWLHNGKPNDVQSSSTTEDGAYTLNGIILGNAISKNSNAKYYIPSENQWIKAAYYKGGGTSAGYWFYPTQANSAPSQIIYNAIDNGPVFSSYICSSPPGCLVTANNNYISMIDGSITRPIDPIRDAKWSINNQKVFVITYNYNNLSYPLYISNNYGALFIPAIDNNHHIHNVNSLDISSDGLTVALIRSSLQNQLTTAYAMLSTDGGQTWDTIPINSLPFTTGSDFRALYSIALSGDGSELWIAGTERTYNGAQIFYHSIIFYSNNGGGSWSKLNNAFDVVVSPGATTYFSEIYPITKIVCSKNNNTLYTIGLLANDSNSITVFKSTNLGTSWTKQLAQNNNNIYDIETSDNGNYVLIGTKTHVYISIDGGLSWISKLNTSNTGNGYASVSISNDGSKMISSLHSGTYAEIYHSNDYGMSWYTMLSNNDFLSYGDMSPDGSKAVVYNRLYDCFDTTPTPTPTPTETQITPTPTKTSVTPTPTSSQNPTPTPTPTVTVTQTLTRTPTKTPLTPTPTSSRNATPTPTPKQCISNITRTPTPTPTLTPTATSTRCPPPTPTPSFTPNVQLNDCLLHVTLDNLINNHHYETTVTTNDIKQISRIYPNKINFTAKNDKIQDISFVITRLQEVTHATIHITTTDLDTGKSDSKILAVENNNCGCSSIPCPQNSPTPTPSMGPITTVNYNGCIRCNNPTFITQLTTVGTNGVGSFYNTYDQNGNVWEWLESGPSIITQKYLRGGSYLSTDAEINGNTLSSRKIATKNTSSPEFGFRIASYNNDYNFRCMSQVNDTCNDAHLISKLGKVKYSFYISQYEVTNSEYMAFLNSVAYDKTTDSLQLYKPVMETNPNGGIIRRFNTNKQRYEYSLKPNMGNKPVNFVTWSDAIRYCNWLHNYFGDTENGAYNAKAQSPTRSIAAKYFLPNENEWYKAAYYHGSDNRYYNYATQSNRQPLCPSVDSDGNGPFDPGEPCGCDPIELCNVTLTDTLVDGGQVFLLNMLKNPNNCCNVQYKLSTISPVDIAINSRDNSWTDTGIDLLVDSTTVFTATGSVYYSVPNGPSLVSDPDGVNANNPTCKTAGATNLPNISLIGKIDDGCPFLIGSSLTFTSAYAGRLYLAINDTGCSSDNSGYFYVHIEYESEPGVWENADPSWVECDPCLVPIDQCDNSIPQNSTPRPECPTPTPSGTPTPTPTPTPSGTPTPTPTPTPSPNCCDWNPSNATFFVYNPSCESGWMTINTQYTKISNNEWNVSEQLDCGEYLDITVTCDPNIVFDGSDSACASKWQTTVNTVPCVDGPYVITYITSSNLYSLGLSPEIINFFETNPIWPQSCDCNAPPGFIVSGNPRSPCDCCPSSSSSSSEYNS